MTGFPPTFWSPPQLSAIKGFLAGLPRKVWGQSRLCKTDIEAQKTVFESPPFGPVSKLGSRLWGWSDAVKSLIPNRAQGAPNCNCFYSCGHLGVGIPT